MKLTRQNFQFIAETLAEALVCDKKIKQDTAMKILNVFTNNLATTNPRFRKDIFQKAVLDSLGKMV